MFVAASNKPFAAETRERERECAARPFSCFLQLSIGPVHTIRQPKSHPRSAAQSSANNGTACFVSRSTFLKKKIKLKYKNCMLALLAVSLGRDDASLAEQLPSSSSLSSYHLIQSKHSYDPAADVRQGWLEAKSTLRRSLRPQAET
jgi:hypothetical protein